MCKVAIDSTNRKQAVHLICVFVTQPLDCSPLCCVLLWWWFLDAGTSLLSRIPRCCLIRCPSCGWSQVCQCRHSMHCCQCSWGHSVATSVHILQRAWSPIGPINFTQYIRRLAIVCKLHKPFFWLTAMRSYTQASHKLGYYKLQHMIWPAREVL